MRKLLAALTAFLLVSSIQAETITVAQDHAVDSDVVLESAVREIKSAPRDTVNIIGDGVKYVTDEAVTAAKGAAAAFKSNPVEKAEKAGMIDVADAWDSSNDILFRSYKVTDAVGDELLAGSAAAPGAVVDVRGFFTGIDFPKHTSVFYRPDFNRLFVRHTLANILAIEDVLAEQHSAVREMLGQQVEIETKFVEVNQSTLNELGFDWNFISKYGGNANLFENLSLAADTDLLVEALRTAGKITGGKTAAFDAQLPDSDVLTLSKDLGSLRWSLVINALEQSDDADVLSAPRIVTRDGSRASITVGEERMVAKEFEVEYSESSLFIENNLDKEIMGVHLEVTPEIRGDDLLDLELKPKVIDLIGYDWYNVHPEADMLVWAGEDAGGMYVNGRFPILNVPAAGISTAWDLMSATLSGGDPNNAAPGNGLTETDSAIYYDSNRPIRHEEYGIPLAALNGRVPYYRLREMETQVTVADGSTVGMGGLIYDKLETFRDKVPLLGSIPLVGRLFRSEGEKSVKRNLMIFVTATQVDVNGRRNADLALKK